MNIYGIVRVCRYVPVLLNVVRFPQVGVLVATLRLQQCPNDYKQHEQLANGFMSLDT